MLTINSLKTNNMTKPKDIPTNHWFMGSPFQNSECETILRNIILLQKHNNSEEWTPFTWDEYKSFCTHKVNDSEKGVLKAFVEGGRPVWNTSANISPGWLAIIDKKYHLTDKMIDLLSEYTKKQ
jgi:hypothetical protein